MNLLIVDDDSVVRGYVRRLLQAHPEMKVIGEAEDGEEPVRLARDLRPDLVLMDRVIISGRGGTADRDIEPGRGIPRYN